MWDQGKWGGAARRRLREGRRVSTLSGEGLDVGAQSKGQRAEKEDQRERQGQLDASSAISITDPNVI